MYLVNQPCMMLSEVESLLGHLNAYSDTSVVQFFQAQMVPYSATQQVIRLEFKIFSLGHPIGMMTMTTVDPGIEYIEVLYWSYATSKIHLVEDTLPDDSEILTIFKDLENGLGDDPDVDDRDNHYRYPTDLLEFLGITEEEDSDCEDDEDDEDEDDEDDEDEE